MHHRNSEIELRWFPDEAGYSAEKGSYKFTRPSHDHV